MSPTPKPQSNRTVPRLMQPPRKEEPKPVEPPPLDRYAEVGDVVQWYPGADPTVETQPAVVTKVGSDGIIVANVMNCEIHDTIPQDGCYPMDHPKARQMGPQEGGGWRHKPLTIAARAMYISLGLLEWNGKDQYVPTQKALDVASGKMDLAGEKKEEPKPDPVTT